MVHVASAIDDIKNVNFEKKTADVHFIVSAGGRMGRYVPESRYRYTVFTGIVLTNF